MARAAWLVCLLLPGVVAAETAYVIDHLRVSLRAEASEDAARTKTVETGHVLEVLERDGNFAHVRDAQGGEGWIDARYLSPQPPARVRVKELEGRISALQSRLGEAPVPPVSPAPESPGTAKLKAELIAARAQLAEANAALTDAKASLTAARAEPPVSPIPVDPASSAPTPAPAPQSAPATDGGFPFLWLAVSFAMLGVGFAGGVIWVREAVRRRMGGMYLRM